MKRVSFSASIVLAFCCTLPDQASAFLLQFGVGGPTAGSIVNVGAANVNTGLIPFTFVGANATVAGMYGEYIKDVGGATTAAMLKVTNLSITNTSGVAINDNLYMVSDIFNPTLVPKPGWAGAKGSYLGGPGDLVTTQTQMNFLTTPINAFVPPTGWSITSPAVSLFNPAVFYELGTGTVGAGVRQLVGVFNVQLPALGDAVFLPGSIELTDNMLTSEFGGTDADPIVPIPPSIVLLGSGLAGLAIVRRKRTECPG